MSTRNFILALVRGGRFRARAEGGDLETVSPIVPTWGTQTTEQAGTARADEEGARWAAEQDARQARERHAFLTGPYGGDAAKAIEQRNRDTLATADKLRALGIAPHVPTAMEYGQATKEQRKGLDDERRAALESQAMERQARFSLNQQAVENAAVHATGTPPAAAAEEKAPPATLGQRALGAIGNFGSDLMKQSGNVDIGYHPAGGYVAPQMIALPTYQPAFRADGGPMLVKGGWQRLRNALRGRR